MNITAETVPAALKGGPRYLDGKVCVIVGVASLRGIGYATAELFARHGAKLVVVDLMMDDTIAADVSQAIATRNGEAPELLGLRCDIGRAADCQGVIDQAVARFGRIDCLVNTAAIVKSDGLLAISGDDLDLILNVNLKGAFNLCQNALRVFEEQGSGTIVNIASVAAQRRRAGGRRALRGLERRRHQPDAQHRARIRPQGHPGERDLSLDDRNRDAGRQCDRGAIRPDRRCHPAETRRPARGYCQCLPVSGIRSFGLCHRHHAGREWRQPYPLNVA